MTSDITKRQRTVPSAKAYDFIWRRPVPIVLQNGAIFDRYDEEAGTLELGCLVRVDEFGFFVSWKSEQGEGQALELSQVSDVRTGTKPKEEKLVVTLTERGTGSLDDRMVTICQNLDLVNINYTHMVAPDAETANFWIQNLRPLTHNTKQSNVCPMTQLRKHWIRLRLTVNPVGKVPVRVISKTFASGKTEKMIFQSLKDLGLPSGKNDGIDPADFSFEKFYELFHRICPRTDIEELFKQLSTGTDSINVDKMIEFINETQRDPRLNEILFPFANPDKIRYIIDTYEENEAIKAEKEKVTIECFYRYLMSNDNAPVFLDRLDICHDMDQPLSHYYINSSHNTYLSGRQFGGKSSVEMYRQVLLAGCRCIELDCWDGKGEDQEPIITHGKAMCTDVLFKEVMYAIRDTAFVTTDYPVILSFENHCSKPQQFKLAKYSEDILGDFLLTKPIDKFPLEPGAPLPSPENVKRKILIKNKRLKPEVEKQQLEMFMKGQIESIQEEADDPGTVLDGEAGPLNDVEPTPATTNKDINPHPESNGSKAALPNGSGDPKKGEEVKKGEGEEAEDDEGNLTAEEEQAMLAQYHYTGATTSIHPYLSAMVNYAQPVKFQGFDVAEEENVHHHMSSFSETVALGYMKNDAIEFVNYNKRQMSRIYPRGNRVDSSNFMPQIFWNAGCQMVALNFQTPDLGMQLNQGKFEYNGNCGYLLKPEFMRRSERTFDPFSESPMDGVIAATCEVHIISGQFLSDKKIGTYVEVDMYGLPTDTIRKEFRTRVVPNNGLNPVYGEDAVFVFRKIVLPDLAVLRIGVYEETGKLIGQRVLPLDGLQSGYRHISLRTEGNFPLALPTLFCKVTQTTYIPEGLTDLVDALSDPRAFLSKEEKRLKQLESLGIESTDIAEVPTTGKSAKKAAPVKKGPANAAGPGTNAPATSVSGGPGSAAEKKVPDPKFDPISLELLQTDKSYQKLLKKQAKELDSVHKRHEKELAALHKQQTLVTDKLNAQHAKEKNSKKGSKGLLICCLVQKPIKSDFERSLSLSENGQVYNVLEESQKAQMQELVKTHTEEWTNLKLAQRKEEQDLLLGFVELRREILVKVMKEAQAEQVKELQIIHDREVKQMKAEQTQTSIESNRQVMSDTKLHNKAERDRRKRELNDYHTKRFIDQRRAMAQKHDRHTQELKKKHELEDKELNEGMDMEKENYNLKYQEDLLASKKATVI